MKKTTKPSTASAKAASPKAAPAKSAAKSAAIKQAAAPAKKKPVGQALPPATFISARADIGFGNHLYLRGEGPGLSWDHGVAMDCVANDLWSATLKGALAPVVFKILVNDLSWNTGNDYVVEPGQSVTVNPVF